MLGRCAGPVVILGQVSSVRWSRMRDPIALWMGWPASSPIRAGLFNCQCSWRLPGKGGQVSPPLVVLTAAEVCAVSVAGSVAWSKGWIAHTARASPVAGPSWLFLWHSIEGPWEGTAFCVGVLAAAHACLLRCCRCGGLLLLVFVG